MRLLRAILSAAILWVLIFFEVSILMFGLKLEQNSSLYYILHYILLFILTLLSSLFYFTGKKIKTDVVEGISLGVVFVITRIILDALLTVPLFIQDYNFFLDFYLWMGYLETIIVAGIAGAIKK
jgi:hypothetical protein